MTFIYLDESGDLGFDLSKSKTSKYFVVTALLTNQPRPLNKIIRKEIRGFNRRQKKSHPGVLHANRESPRIRHRVLSAMAGQEISILVVYLNKTRVYTKLQDEKPVLYNYVANFLLDRIIGKELVTADRRVKLIASRRETNKFLNANFKSYLEGQTRGSHRVDLEVLVKSPHEDKCLQIVDMASWAVFRKLEHGDDSYCNAIRTKIIEESPLYP